MDTRGVVNGYASREGVLKWTDKWSTQAVGETSGAAEKADVLRCVCDYGWFYGDKIHNCPQCR